MLSPCDVQAATKTPAKPIITSAKATDNTVRLTWKKAKNAKKYKVFVQTGKDGWKYWKSVKATKKNKKKYSNTLKYKLKKSGKKYKVYVKKHPYRAVKTTTARSYKYKGKYDTVYRFVVQAVNGKKLSRYSAPKAVRTVWKPIDIWDPDFWGPDDGNQNPDDSNSTDESSDDDSDYSEPDNGEPAFDEGDPVGTEPIGEILTIDSPDAKAAELVKRLLTKKETFTLALKASSQEEAGQILEQLSEQIAITDEFGSHFYKDQLWDTVKEELINGASYCMLQFARGEGGYSYVIIQDYVGREYVASKEYFKMTFEEKNKLWAEDVEYSNGKSLDDYLVQIMKKNGGKAGGISYAFGDRSLYELPVDEYYRTVLKCEPGTPYTQLSEESRYLYSTVRLPFRCGYLSDRKDYMVYRTEINYSGDTAFERLVNKTDHGVCASFASRNFSICCALGIKDCWIVVASELDHAWSITKVKNAAGQPVYYINDNGRTDILRTEEDFSKHPCVGGDPTKYIEYTKKAMGSAYPF